MKSKLVPIVLLLLMLGSGETVFAAEGSVEAASAVEAAKEEVQLNINIVWTCIAAFLVFFMQAGFAMVEAGFTRAKNAVNILMKNLMDFSIGSLAYWAVGFAIMYGTTNTCHTKTTPTTRLKNIDGEIIGRGTKRRRWSAPATTWMHRNTSASGSSCELSTSTCRHRSVTQTWTS